MPTKPSESLDIYKSNEGLVRQSLVDLERFRRFRNGESFIEIALADGISPAQATSSVRKGCAMYEGEQLLMLRGKKAESAIKSEELRSRVRERVGESLPERLESLLEGKREVAFLDKDTGKIVTQVITDPEMISLGLKHAADILDLRNKPAQAQTFVNIQNNQQINQDGQGTGKMTYEDRLQRIRNTQKSGAPKVEDEAEIVDVESSPIEDGTATAASSEWDTEF